MAGQRCEAECGRTAVPGFTFCAECVAMATGDWHPTDEQRQRALALLLDPAMVPAASLDRQAS